MQQDVCVWYLIFTSEEGRSLYERCSWHRVPTTVRQGLLASEHPAPDGGYTVGPYDPVAELSGWTPVNDNYTYPTTGTPLATIYEANNATRPLTVVRD